MEDDAGAAGDGGNATQLDASTAGNGGSGTGGSPEPPDASASTGGAGDRDGGPDGSPDDASISAETGSDASGNTVTVIEDFLSTANVDLVASTASVDTAGVGRAFGPAPYVLGSFGDGSDGPYNSGSDAGITVQLAAGEYNFTTFDARNVEINVAGDVTIRVQGDFVLDDYAYFEATGSISVYVGGQVRMIGGGIQSLGGATIVHQHGTAPFTNLDGFASAVQGGARAEIFSRGPMLMAGGYYTRDDNGSGLSGDVIVRSGGAITLGEGNTEGYAFAGEPSTVPVGDVGDLRFYSEGSITTPNGFIGLTYLDTPGQNIVVRAVGDYELVSTIDASLNVGPGGTIDVIAGGTLTTGDAYFDVSAGTLGGGSVTARAGAINIGANTSMFFDAPPSSLVPTPPSLIDLATTGNFVLAAGTRIWSGDVYCAKGGSVRIRAEGDLTLGPVPFSNGISAGDSLGSAGCTMGDGGDVTLLAGGTYTADPTAYVAAGTGTNPGTVTAAGGQSVTVGPIDPGLITWTTIQSGALTVQGPGAVFEGATLTWAKQRSESPVIEISLDGSDTWVLASGAVGQPLSGGWKYRVRMPTGQFDAAELDRVELTYSVQ